MLLIHPSKCNGRCFEVIQPYLKDYYLICPTLDGHNVNDSSIYENHHKETDIITAYLKSQGIKSLHTVLGISMGTFEAYELYRQGNFEIKHLVLDGAPFHKINWLMKRFMLSMQFLIRKRCIKKPNGKFKADILYPQVAPMMKEITAHYDDCSMINMINEIGLKPDKCIDTDKVIFLYGDTDTYIKAVSDIKKNGYNRCKVIIKKNCGHAQYILVDTKKYADILINGREDCF